MEKEIRIRFVSEVEVYEAEYRLAVDINIAHNVDICQVCTAGGL